MEVAKHFPAAMGVDDFIARLEMALAAYGFTGDNAIGEQVGPFELDQCKPTTPMARSIEQHVHCESVGSISAILCWTRSTCADLTYSTADRRGGVMRYCTNCRGPKLSQPCR